MTPLRQIFHRRSITFAVIALLLSFGAFGFAIAFSSMYTLPPGPRSGVAAVIVFVLACAVCVHATVNLIQDVGRCYSPDRCSLAAVILFFAYALLVLFGFMLAKFLFRKAVSG